MNERSCTATTWFSCRGKGAEMTVLTQDADHAKVQIQRPIELVVRRAAVKVLKHEFAGFNN